MSVLQVPACDSCSVGVMDATNPHLLGTCSCSCHAPSRETALLERGAAAVREQSRARDERHEAGLLMADDPHCPDVLRLAALGEEFGEVCRAVHDGDQDALGRELTQLAGVALAWGVALARVSA